MKKREHFIPLSRHWLDGETERAVLEVLRSPWITTGPVTKAFEEEFSRHVRAPFAVAVSSCTGGLFMVYQALGIAAGDEVVVPATTWPATANAAAILGARVIFADVDYRTVCVTRETLEPCLSTRTKAVVVVHFAGMSCHLAPIIELCREKQITLIEDSAHALGTQQRDTHVGGSYAFASVYSFHPIKSITTGEGGMVTCHEEGAYRKISLAKFHGVDRDAWKAYAGRTIPVYDVVFPALKFNLTDIQSAIGRTQLFRLGEFIARRKQIAQRYLKGLSKVAGLDLPVEDPGHSWHIFVVKLNKKAGMNREQFMTALQEWNIGSGIHFLPVNELSYYRQFDPAPTPIARKIGKSCISLPLFPMMTDDDADYVIDCVKAILAVHL